MGLLLFHLIEYILNENMPLICKAVPCKMDVLHCLVFIFGYKSSLIIQQKQLSCLICRQGEINIFISEQMYIYSYIFKKEQQSLGTYSLHVVTWRSVPVLKQNKYLVPSEFGGIFSSQKLCKYPVLIMNHPSNFVFCIKP